MAGPILTFLDTLQDRQPVRNALRGVLGLPQRRSTVIDPMEEMAARDAERGGDISNPNPMTRPAPRIASTATGGPGVAAALPAPAQAIDETQPYQGMGMMQAMTTPPSAAIRQRRQAASQPMARAGGPASLSQSISLIHQSPDLPAADRAQMLADLMYRSATEATDNDRRETLVRIGDTYMKQHMVLTGMAAGQESLTDARKTANKISKRSKKSADEAGAREERMNERAITGVQETNAQIHGFETNDTSRSTSSKDYISALVQDPTMPVSVFANQSRGAMEFAMFKTPDKAVDPALLDAEYQRSFDRGFNVRLTQLAEAGEGDEALLHPYHPMFNDIAQHYRGLVQKNPESYDQMQLKLAGQISAATSQSLTQKKYPQKAILEYAQGLATDILGPKPERTGWLKPLLGY